MEQLQEFRCVKCHKLLFKGLLDCCAIVEVKCKGCKEINRFSNAEGNVDTSCCGKDCQCKQKKSE